jgi:osmoprotectant transport system ATP-binding protein
MIRFEGVSLRYANGPLALDNFSLNIPKGEICVIVGASGSGKTTAMRLINRMATPSSGRVQVNDQDIASQDPITLRRRIGYVIQGGGLIGHMTVGENVGLVPRLLGENPSHIAKVMREGLSRVHLTPEEFAPRFPQQLSGGQRQRVAVARAFAANPDIVLMDEPFGALDNVLREEMQDEFKGIFKASGKTIVFVTHDMHEAIHIGDRIVVLNGGKIVAEGTPAEVVLRPSNDFVIKLLGRRRADLERFAREQGKG